MVRKIGVLEVTGVIFDNAFEEGKVVEMDRTAQAS